MPNPAASDPKASRGRRHPERVDPRRNEFQRDRDRIIHSTAFRRLVYKTQVFLNHEGDLFRTRLTHSLEVAQLARSIARSIGLHEDLVEAIALAHDLGHTPFGHAGQDALDASMREHDPASDGFEHNFQSLRVVDELEIRYPSYLGLNLTFESREGILKHCSRRHAEMLELAEPGGVATRFIRGGRPSLEAQVCNLADMIAYNAHDIDDGVRSGLIQYEQLLELGPCRRFHEETLAEHPQVAGRRLLYEVTRRMLSAQVHDIVDTTLARLASHHPASADEARQQPALVGFSMPCADEAREVTGFLRGALYRHPQVVEKTEGAKGVIRDLFHIYAEQPGLMPEEHAGRRPVVQAVADYIAGMTDRYALREHARLCPPGEAGGGAEPPRP